MKCDKIILNNESGNDNDVSDDDDDNNDYFNFCIICMTLFAVAISS